MLDDCRSTRYLLSRVSRLDLNGRVTLQLRRKQERCPGSEKEEPCGGFPECVLWIQQLCSSLGVPVVDPGTMMELVQQLFHPSQFKGTALLPPTHLIQASAGAVGSCVLV